MTGPATTFRGAELVTHEGRRRADIVVSGGRIAEIGDVSPIGEVIDATGLLILPGMVDTHVHLMDPGPTEREDFPTGTRAAAARGVTTIIEHTHASPVRSVSNLEEKKSHLAGRSNVDFGLAAHVWPEDIPGLGDLWSAGIAFFKIFTCTTHGVPGLDTARLLGAMEMIASFDGRCLIHCEDETITAAAERVLREQGRMDGDVIPEWRNREAELVSIATASVLAQRTGVKATLAHVSSPEVVEVIEHFRSQGADIAAEACPQYLALDESEVREHGALRKFTPPARLTGESERDHMWDLVRRRSFSHFSTDHAPSTMEQKTSGDIWDAPFGLPGIDTTLAFLVDAALSGRIELSDVVDLYSHRPAVRYGLAPSKGVLEPGSDADLVLIDPDSSWTVTDSDVISKAGWSPYSGRTFRGRAVATYLRGQEIARDGKPHDQRTGRFIHGLGAEHEGG